jgi:DNA repair protein RecO (recombination protein O)
MAFHRYRTQGFFLKKRARGEADQVFTVFTKDFGKLELTAKSIRKINSKLKPGAEIFYLSAIEFINGRANKILTDAIAIEKSQGIRQDCDKLFLAEKICQGVDDLTLREEKDVKIWELLEEIFPAINNLDCESNTQKLEKLKIIFHCFAWRAICVSGHGPDFYNCSVCQKKLNPRELYFDYERRGVIGYECQKTAAGTVQNISVNALKAMRFLSENNAQRVVNLKLGGDILKEIEFISDKFFQENFAKIA